MPRRVRVIVKCPDCIEARVDSCAITIRHCPDDDTWAYRFTCPFCRKVGVAQTSAAAALETVDAGADLEVWRLPLELGERRYGPPFTAADVLTLHCLLLDDDWLDALLRSES